jgi:hypothetical protein
MHDNKLYDQPSEVCATEGEVKIDGPDAVHVSLTPEAADETAERLTDESVMARGQRRLKGNPHQPQ